MLKKLIVFTVCLLFLNPFCRADEGMWLPLLIKRLNYEDMQKKGLKLTADEIYSVNHSSLKDAVVNFGGYCTGEIISEKGLILTNHHCGYESVQSHSTVEHDYLTDGFWAKKMSEELPTPGLTVTFLVRMEDVTDKILGECAGLNPEEKEAKIEQISADLEKTAIAGTHYTSEIKSFFEGNEYYLFVYEVFKDIRLVGAPPSSIGKFGGDTDNWMWPRHTGDFSMFRVYTAPDGKPADYSANNVPLKPKFHLTISLDGYEKGSFSMVMGYPGSTERYLTSGGVKLAYEITNPDKIKIREKRLALMKADMDANPEIRIKYASNYAQVSNYYKYFIGQNQGLRRLDVADQKKAREQKFQEWADSDPERKKTYGDLLPQFEKTYEEYKVVAPAYTYLEEAAFGTEILLFAYKLNGFYQALQNAKTPQETQAAAEAAKVQADEFFKNYNPPTDQKIFAALLQMYHDDVNPKLVPSVLKDVDKKYKGDFSKFAAYVFSNSILASKEKMDNFLKKPSAKVLEKDPAFKTSQAIISDFRALAGPFLGMIFAKLDAANNLYLRGIREMNKDAKLYPDANFSMRLSYGSVEDYYPKDAAHFSYYTTIEGIMEKEDPKNDEFIVPKRLVELYNQKDYGRYGYKGTLPVNFISTNDITGGNSGSPVMNAYGHLIGCAFDGNWEAMSGDIIYEPKLQRTISVDVRYILFIIDKYAGAENLIKEMTIVQNYKSASASQEGPTDQNKPLETIKAGNKKMEKVN